MLHLSRTADTHEDLFIQRYQALVTWGLRLCKNDRQQAEDLAVYQKPLVCFCALPGALHVNDYQSADRLRRNLQLPSPQVESMNSAVSFDADGLSNVVLAASTTLLASSRYAPLDVAWEDGRRYMTKDRLSPPAPDGYSIGANNSPTIAFASGIVADAVRDSH